MKTSDARAARLGHRFGAGDVYAASDLAAFIDREAAMPSIAEQSRAIRDLLDKVPAFAAACDYGWACDAESYDTPTDAAYQLRALTMLAKYWIESPDKTHLAPRMSGIVATQEYITRYGLFSGRLMPRSGPSGARVLAIPASLVEMASWLFAGLRCWTAREIGVDHDEAEDGGWTIVSTPTIARPPRPFDHPTAYELIARALAERGRDLALYGSNAALLIREQVRELAGPGGDIDPTAMPHFDQNATYMTVEFVIAHELGHALSTLAKDTGEDGYRLTESDADRTAELLVAMTASQRSFGWTGDSPGPWAQAALGLAFFHIVINGRLRLIDGLNRGGDETHFARHSGPERQRASIAGQGLISRLGRMRDTTERNNARKIAILVVNAEAFLRDLAETVAGVPDLAVARALAIAEASSSIDASL